MGSSSAKKVLLGNEAEGPETTIEIKIKTLDSQTYTMRVDKQMPVPALKEQIASVTGVLSEQQRLICRGKVLKDDQLLSAYHVEDGHTLHLVVRQPPPLSDPNSSNYPASDPASSTNGGSARLVAPGVVIETFNVPNQGDGVPPEFSRIVSAVLGSLGIPTAGSGGEGIDVRAHGLQRHERTSDPTGVSDATLPQPELRAPSDRSHSAFGFPTSVHVGSANPPVIPDSLTTLSQYLSHVRHEFDAIGRGLEQNNQSAAAPLLRTSERGPNSASHSQNAVEGLPTPTSLAEVMLSTRQMLTEQVGENLLQHARQLENQVNVTDSLLRSSMQTSALRTGVLLHNLGAFLLELGRTTMTLRLGETPAEALVNAGPAVFISPTGPNPIMVQPFPFQPGTSFGSVPMGGVQSGSGLVNGLGVQRRIDIQIRRGSSAATPNVSREELGDPQQPSERRNSASDVAGENLNNQAAPTTNVSRESSVRFVPVRTMVAAVPSHLSRLQSDSSVNSLGLYYPFLGRFQHLASGPVSTEEGSQASSEHHSTGIQAGQQAQNNDGAVRDGSSLRQQELSNAASVNINIVSPGGTQNNQESGRQIPESVAQLLRALFPGGEIHLEEANLQGQATEPNLENGGASSRASDPVGPEPRTSDEGIFLSNLLHQIMPLISQNEGAEPDAVPLEESSASEHRMAQDSSTQAENSGAGTSSRRSDTELNPPSPKRQKKE